MALGDVRIRPLSQNLDDLPRRCLPRLDGAIPGVPQFLADMPL